MLWLAILLAFYRTVFARTSTIAGWSEPQYFFFVGCFFALNGLIETLFLDNCNEFAELVRTGDLDFLLLKPIDEQFLITCRRIDWGTAPNVLMGAVRHGRSPWSRWAGSSTCCGSRPSWSRSPAARRSPTASCCCLTSLSVWMVRNQSLMEMWWLFSSLARYPKEIFAGPLGRAAGHLLHVHHADPGGRQRAGQRDGPRARPADGRADRRRDRGPALAQPPVLPARAAVVSQREQLRCLPRCQGGLDGKLSRLLEERRSRASRAGNNPCWSRLKHSRWATTRPHKAQPSGEKWLSPLRGRLYRGL